MSSTAAISLVERRHSLLAIAGTMPGDGSVARARLWHER